MTLKTLFRGILGAKVSDEQAEKLEAAVRAVVAESIAAEKPPEPAADGRMPMDPEDWRAMSAASQGDQREYDALMAARADRAQKIEAEEARRNSAIQELEKLWANPPEESGYLARRDSRWTRRWEGRPRYVDAHIAPLLKEAEGIRPQIFVIPPAALNAREASPFNHRVSGEIIPDEPSRSRVESQRYEKVVGNKPSCEARVAALRQFAEDIAAWTRKGLFADEAEFLAMFRKAFDALPAIVPLQQILAADPRGRRFVKDAAPLPPAA